MSPHALNLALLKLNRNVSLDADEMSHVMESLMNDELTDAEIAEFLLRLREKGESPLEVAAAARVMRKYSLKLSKTYAGLLDTCGTGGDGRQTVNISTLAALTAASAGAVVAKHGNRSVSSQCGSADLLESMGFKIDLPVPATEACIEKFRFGFLFAPNFHQATRFAMAARKKIQGKTLFNLLGPLSNPAGADCQLIGVYNEKLVGLLARTLLDLGCVRALVVHGRDGLDEITLSTSTWIAELSGGKIRHYEITPEEFGLKRVPLAEIQRQSKDECKLAAIQVLQGAAGPLRDVVVLNAAAALAVADKTSSIKDGIALCQDLLRSGIVYKNTMTLVDFTQKMSKDL